MVRLGIIVANFGRVPVLKIFCAGIDRLRKETLLDIPVVCAGDIDGAETCERYGIQHIEFPNNPLTAKFNRACSELHGKVDYVMILGSDNLISTKAFLAVQAEADKGTDLIGFDSIYFFGLDDVYAGKLVHFKHTTVLGVGRTISARVLTNVYWQPWNRELNRGIDTCMLDSVRGYVRSRVLLSNHFLVDLKSSWNLNKLHFWYKKLGALPSSDLLWSNIGEEEADLIREYLGRQ